MGFSCGIYYVRKMNEAITVEDINNVERYHKYFNNAWAQKNFSTVEDYCKAYEYTIPDSTLLDFYNPLFIKTEYGETLTKEVGTWYSAGRVLYDWLSEYLHTINFSGICVITYTMFLDLIRHFWEKYIEMTGEFATVDRAYKYVDIEDEESDITSIKCDGLEVTFEDNTIKRLDTYSDWGNGILVPKTYSLDIEDVYFYRSLISSCLLALKEIDWEKDLVFFSGGW